MNDIIFFSNYLEFLKNEKEKIQKRNQSLKDAIIKLDKQRELRSDSYPRLINY